VDRCLWFLQTRVNLKSSTRCCEILVLVERFFRHVVDAYAERKEHRPCGELLSRYRFEWWRLRAQSRSIFETYHTIPNVNESYNKFYFAKDDAEITIPKDSHEVRDINEFLKRTILRKRPHRDALEIIDVVRGDNNNNNNNDTDDDNSEGGEYPITLRANYNTMRCEIRRAYKINFGKPNSIESLLGILIKAYCDREGGSNRTCRST